MSELRLDAFTGRYTAVVPARQVVSSWTGQGKGALPELTGRCPFCPGHESDTEETVAAIPERGPWRVRVVRNLFPVVSPAATATEDDVALVGQHEVVIESPHHDLDLCDLEHDALVDVLTVFRARVRVLGARPDAAHVALFRNRGRRSGSSQPHPHSQILSVPVLGDEVERRASRARAFAAAHPGETLLARERERAFESGDRLVEVTGHHVAFCPYAPLQPFQMIVAPLVDVPSLADASDDALNDLAPLLARSVARVKDASGEAAYNLVCRLPPVREGPEQGAFWYFDIIPRLVGQAGFELSTGIQIVTLPPEDAAATLRGSAH
jgi:UDPglucose--hexose-1-phosphate uridylyltransferase